LSYLSPPFGITREGSNPRSKFQKTNSKLQKNFKIQIPKIKTCPKPQSSSKSFIRKPAIISPSPYKSSFFYLIFSGRGKYLFDFPKPTLKRGAINI